MLARAAVTEAGSSRDRELLPVVETRIEEGTLPIHLRVGDVRVPVGDRSPARIRVQVDPREAKGRRKKGGGRLPVRTERLSIHVQLGVVLTGSPAGEHLAYGGLVHAEQVRDRLQVRRQRNDRADVEIAVGPAIAPLTDAFGEAVIDGGVAERAGDADRGDLAALGECVQPDDRVRLEQRYRAGGIVEV